MALRPKRRKSSAKVLPPNISYVPGLQLRRSISARFLVIPLGTADAGAAAAPSPGASPGEDPDREDGLLG